MWAVRTIRREEPSHKAPASWPSFSRWQMTVLLARW